MTNSRGLNSEKSLLIGLCIGIYLIFLYAPLAAQTLRDPTLPPVQIDPVSPGVREKSLSSERGPLTIVVRGGRSYVVMGTRLYAQGQRFGEARIERISETEVWFLEKGVVHKVSRFPGIQRRTVVPVPALPVRVASSPEFPQKAP